MPGIPLENPPLTAARRSIGTIFPGRHRLFDCIGRTGRHDELALALEAAFGPDRTAAREKFAADPIVQKVLPLPGIEKFED
jgi:hypothetical protein